MLMWVNGLEKISKNTYQIKKKLNVDVENCGSFKSFGYIYIYIYIKQKQKEW